MSESSDFSANRNFPPNTREPKNISRVTEGDIVKPKRTMSQKLSYIFGGQNFQSAGGQVILDIVIPAIKQTLVDAATQLVERLIFGESLRPRSRSRSTWTSYQQMYRREERPPTTGFSQPRSRPSYDIDRILLESRNDAENVLSSMLDLLGHFDAVSVADLNEMIGVSSSHSDQKWGWTNLRDARVRITPDGYLVDLPEPSSLD